MQVRKLYRTELLAAAVAPAALLVLGSVAHAQVPYYPVSGNTATINTFDTAASFSTAVTYNPPPMIARFDYGSVTPSGAANHSVTWSNGAVAGGYDDTAATGGPGAQGTAADTGGSLALAQKFSGASDGAGSSAFTFDVYPGGGDQMITSVSFDILVNPNSAKASDGNGGFGYFQMAYRDLNYNFSELGESLTVDGISKGGPAATQYAGPGFTLGDANGTSDPGTWDHLVYTFLTPVDIRALTLQDYNNGSQNGTLTYNVDNLQVGLVPVPEPASLGLLALGVPALLARRRSAKR